jgi:hypothetical protein
MAIPAICQLCVTGHQPRWSSSYTCGSSNNIPNDRMWSCWQVAAAGYSTAEHQRLHDLGRITAIRALLRTNQTTSCQKVAKQQLLHQPLRQHSLQGTRGATLLAHAKRYSLRQHFVAITCICTVNNMFGIVTLYAFVRAKASERKGAISVASI